MEVPGSGATCTRCWPPGRLFSDSGRMIAARAIVATPVAPARRRRLLMCAPLERALDKSSDGFVGVGSEGVGAITKVLEVGSDVISQRRGCAMQMRFDGPLPDFQGGGDLLLRQIDQISQHHRLTLSWR